eukprot:CAMPEP_0184317320 /NCGR_PEP_ID=MMETSP1049-20130417/95922_1 /TAXON_ID=77928 /ORGANISM="Proteomonas sulcata, Strain CCMP704" /LENGTH=93 /DNA_ID=CAMNT_0026636673 /DNA_START=1 /DNA_END=279 /DNA_ORIENTATION=+
MQSKSSQRVAVFAEEAMDWDVNYAAFGCASCNCPEKIETAQAVAASGSTTCLASGMDMRNIGRIFDGEDVGTVFPAEKRPASMEDWFMHTVSN